jgi:CRP/FNR family cyclic AMP-dependent transcriptional regulator
VPPGKNSIMFAEGDAADSIHYIHSGKIKVAAVSCEGKEALIAIPGPQDFFGEECLTTQTMRMAFAIGMSAGSLLRSDKSKAVELVQRSARRHWR